MTVLCQCTSNYSLHILFGATTPVFARAAVLIVIGEPFASLHQRTNDDISRPVSVTTFLRPQGSIPSTESFPPLKSSQHEGGNTRKGNTALLLGIDYGMNGAHSEAQRQGCGLLRRTN